MKKILFPFAVASALSIAALGTLQGQTQEEAAQADEVEKKEEPTKSGDEKVAAGASRAVPGHFLVEVMTDEEVKAFSTKWFPTNVADRVVKLVSRAKELHKLFDEKVKERDEAAAKPGLDDEQIRILAGEVATLKRSKQRLNDSFHQFFFQPDSIGDAKTSMATRIARVADLSAAVEAAEVPLGLRSGPPSPRVVSSGAFNRGGSSRSGGAGVPWPNAPSQFGLLSPTRTDEEVKAFLQERFPAAAMDRIGKLVTRARELVKSLDERIAKIDADLADEKLSDGQIEAMAGLAKACRDTKQRLTVEFNNIAMSNLGMQTMSEAVSWIPQLSRVVKQVEANVESIDVEAIFAKSGLKVSELAQLYGDAIRYKSLYEDGMPAVQAALQNPNLSPQQRKAQEEELKVLQESIQKLGSAIAEYDAIQASKELVPSERYVANAKAMRDVIAEVKKRMGVPGGEAASSVESATTADPKQAHFKLYQRASSLRSDVGEMLKSIGARMAAPEIARAELDRLSDRAKELAIADKALWEPIQGYLNSIDKRPNPDQAMVVDNVVALQHAIREAEKTLGVNNTISVPSDTPYAEVASAIEGSGANRVVVEAAADISPLAKRLIAACENLKSQLEVRLKETDEQLSSPDISLDQLEDQARLKSQLEGAIEYCEEMKAHCRSGALKTAGDFAESARQLRTAAANLLPPKSGLHGPMSGSMGMPGGMMGSSPTGGSSMGMPGMMPGVSGGGPGMMPGGAPHSPFHEVDQLRTRYKKYLDEKNEKGAAEVKDKIAKELARVFDAQQAAREKQLTAAKERLKRLEEQQARRTASRDELIESRTKQIIQELEGTAWNDDAESPW